MPSSRLCNLTGDTGTQQLTDALQHTSLGHIRQDTRHHWWTYSSNWARHCDGSHETAHLHRLGMTDSPHCPWCPTQPDTPEHLLLHCPRQHSHRVALLHSLSGIHPHRPTLTDLLSGCTNTS
ncbi:hypothetical protein E2C01_086501 [Portunus trituberculatus]|uniref:Reverse transcriptase zinc-binding domain-containing protein n=1 Tax=Portunus trituberculatus TaxID=210409 RepID=A0A5B7JAH7_PORTR|nr:hypothetical protein [Portunus trituberculatus]